MKERLNDMKKTTVILSALLALCFMLSACGSKDVSGSRYLGTWKLDNTISAFGEQASIDENWTITLNPDGTAVSVTSDGVSNCSWQETSKGFRLKGDTKLSFTADGDDVVAKFLGVELRFIKQ